MNDITPATSAPSFVEMARAGLFLEREQFLRMRDARNGLLRGFLFVLLVGLLIASANLLGALLASASAPDSALVFDTLENGIRDLPFYDQMLPDMRQQLNQSLEQQRQISGLVGNSISGALLGILTTPLLGLLGWLIFGTLVFAFARALGGRGSLSATLATTALANASSLLSLPLILVGGNSVGLAAGLFGLIISYVAIKETHELPAWRAFWATFALPIVLLTFGLLFLCVSFVLILGAQ